MFTILDFIIVGIILFSGIVSIFRGFVRELFSLVTWVIAAWIAWHFGHQLTLVLEPYIANRMVRLPVAYGGLFIMTMILGGLVNYLLGQLIDRSGLTGTDRTLGLLFGLLRGVLIIAVMLLVVRLTPAPHEVWWKESKLIPIFAPFENWLQSFLPHDQQSNYALRNDTP